jgi:uncharacterized membrane protein YfbV (UPF0208 family)
VSSRAAPRAAATEDDLIAPQQLRGHWQKGEEAMHSAIVVVKMPVDGQSWQGFRATLKEPQVAAALKDKQNVHRIAENVWLVNFQENQEALIKLVDAAARHQFSYGILQLDDKPQWLPASFDPEVIPGE